MEEFKTMDGSHKRLASTSGHVVVVGSEWTRVPDVLAEQALAARCLPRSMFAENKEAGSGEEKLFDPGRVKGGQKEMILAALQRIDDEGRAGAVESAGGVKLLTGQGLPSVEAVSEYAGLKVTRADIEAAFQ